MIDIVSHEKLETRLRSLVRKDTNYGGSGKVSVGEDTIR